MAHVKWECKYHVVILPKYRHKRLYGRVRREVGKVLRALCRQKGIELVEGKAVVDHVHMLLSVPPTYSISHTIGVFEREERGADQPRRAGQEGQPVRAVVLGPWLLREHGRLR